MSMQIFFFFLPTLVSACLLPVLVKRLGHSRTVFFLSFIPLVATVLSLIAILFGERSLFQGPTGAWFIAAILLFLVSKPKPDAEKPKEEGHA